MKMYAKLLTTISLTCVATGAMAQYQVVPAGAGGWISSDQTSAPPPPRSEQSRNEGAEVVFYEALKPHGSWINTSPFGLVWRPNVAVKNASWRPYRDGGKWVWRDNAWFWQSEYEWGWAPFHYGRWMMSRSLGWVWVPGREWAPAWVDWKKEPSQYRWAPLPVERSLYVAAGRSDNGFSWGFQFTLTDEHYVCAPRQEFGETVYIPELRQCEPARVECAPALPPVVVVRPACPPLLPWFWHGKHREEPKVEVIVVPKRAPEPCRPVIVVPERRRDEHPRSGTVVITRPPERTPEPRREEVRSAPQPTDRRTSRILDIASRARK